jgi:hypothetical protein
VTRPGSLSTPSPNKRSLKIETLPDLAAESGLRISPGETVHFLVAETLIRALCSFYRQSQQGVDSAVIGRLEEVRSRQKRYLKWAKLRETGEEK